MKCEARLAGDAWERRGTCKQKLDDLSGACDDWAKAVELGDTTAQEKIEKYCLEGN
ncbi:MAG: hypothetical protein HBSAPP04_23870 [Ignavibacteriaceae bacterium]|nr:MAG: hypothetical protein HBSAPP04_23870 [Ignavibacteriaceae bacterium]